MVTALLVTPLLPAVEQYAALDVEAGPDGAAIADEGADRASEVVQLVDRVLRRCRLLETAALLKLLPPHRFGRCLKRSCLLLDLWSRCGLRPRLHIGTLKEGEERRFHAWVSVPGSAAGNSVESGYSEIWSG